MVVGKLVRRKDDIEDKKDYVTNRRDIITSFNVLNSELFDRKLEFCDVEIEALDTEWGCCINGSITLTDRFPSRAAFQYILGHEMIHLYQYQICKREPDHGPVFKFYEAKLNQMKD